MKIIRVVMKQATDAAEEGTLYNYILNNHRAMSTQELGDIIKEIDLAMRLTISEQKYREIMECTVKALRANKE